jgi:hypothetical protein
MHVKKRGKVLGDRSGNPASAWRRATPTLARFGYFGSYARGDQGVGSDLDLVAVVRDARRPFAERPLALDTAGLPVPAKLLVYTEAEWRALEERGNRLAARLRAETVWVYP